MQAGKVQPNQSISAAAAAKSLQLCPTLCDPMDCSPPGSPVPGIPQARTLEWVAISFSNAGKWKVKAKSLSRAQLLATPWTAAYQAPPSMGFSRHEYWSGLPLPSPKASLGLTKWNSFLHGLSRFTQTGFKKSLFWGFQRTGLPMLETWVLSLVWEDPIYHGTTNPLYRIYWACALEPWSCNYWSPNTLESVLCNKRSHSDEKPVHHSWREVSTHHD